jgi:hypothetical protein
MEPELTIRLEVTYSDGSGWTQKAAYRDGGASLRVSKGSGAAILLVPEYRGIELPPAGSAYPWLIRGPEGAATWTDGVTATILRRLALGGVGFEALNVTRLALELRNRGGPDPWGVDIDRIVEKLALDAFRSTYIKEGEQVDVAVTLPEGTWLPLSPFAEVPQLSVGPGSEEIVLNVPERGGRYIAVAERMLLSVAFERLGAPGGSSASEPGPPVIVLRRF